MLEGDCNVESGVGAGVGIAVCGNNVVTTGDRVLFATVVTDMLGSAEGRWDGETDNEDLTVEGGSELKSVEGTALGFVSLGDMLAVTAPEGTTEGRREGLCSMSDGDGNVDGNNEGRVLGIAMFVLFSNSWQDLDPSTFDGTAHGRHTVCAFCVRPIVGSKKPAGQPIASQPKVLGFNPFSLRKSHSLGGTRPTNPTSSIRNTSRGKFP